MALLLVYLFVAIGFSFYCSVAEAVLLSITPSFIATLKNKKPAAAAKLQALKSNIDRPLAAILSLNTIAHTIGAAGVGAQAVNVWGSQALGIASAVMTLLILIFSEIIPKTIGALYWRSLGPIIGTTVRWLIWCLFPLVWISERLTKLLSGGKSHHTLTREELSAMAEIGAQQGVLKADESRVFRSLMRFPKLTAQDIMTPRVVIIAFEESKSIGETLSDHPDIPTSRLPIYREKLDEVTGFVLRVDLLLAHSRGESDKPLSDYRRDISTLRSDSPLPQVMETLLEDRQHIAMVADQYGSVVGLVTLEDIVETLLGLEIVDEHDEEVDMQQFARNRWRERAKSIGIDPDQP
tara:strand:- start:9369 stop:10421 length:1053 start_codon:yes stop_codon:yes gene_type:complete